MRGSKAKKLRRLVYGDKPSNAKGRRYFRNMTGRIVCDVDRRTYQHAKRGVEE